MNFAGLFENYTPAADCCTIVLCTVFLFMLRSSYNFKRNNLYLFVGANLLTSISAAASITEYCLVHNGYLHRVPFLLLCEDLKYIPLIAVLSIYGMYLINTVSVKDKIRKRMGIMYLLLFLVFAALYIIRPVKINFGMRIDAGYNVYADYYNNVFYYIYIFYILLAGLILFQNKRRFVTKVFRCLRNVILIALAVFVVQAFLRQNTFTCFTFILPIMAVLFLFHHNSYDIETGTLDYQSFHALVKEYHNRDFHFITLLLPDLTKAIFPRLADEFIHFNERYFRDPCTFLLSENKMAMIFENQKNPQFDESITIMLRDFQELYNEYRMNYKIVLIKSQSWLNSATEYLELDDYLCRTMGINQILECTEENLHEFKRAKQVSHQLKMIDKDLELVDDRIKVYCQPVFNNVTKKYDTAEALMRMVLPDLDMVGPDVFVPMAERDGLIHTLSCIILNKTCMAIQNLDKLGYQIERISVNFSIAELREPNFCEDVLGILELNGIEPKRIGIELTESRNEEDFEVVKRVVNFLGGRGIKFYLDDFGTGYSNMERIMGLPFDVIKFDRSLLNMARKDEPMKFMVSSFSEIFRKMDYKILFEGVESDWDELLCRDMGANLLQGYKYSKPIPIEELTTFLSRNV